MNLLLIVLLAGISMIVIERLWPNASLPNTPHWWGRALALNFIQGTISFVATMTWDQWFPEFTLARIDTLPLGVQVFVGYLTITFIFYWWHRARHQVPFLWNWFHQIHHSPARVEIITTFYKHPLEIFANSLLSSWLLYSLLGVAPHAAALVVMITGLAEFFYHWNIRTPYWLGFLFQRPESHRVHHQKDLHHFNYSDLPIWDILFGTFRNPRVTPRQTGFELNQEMQLRQMLSGKSVTAWDRQ